MSSSCKSASTYIKRAKKPQRKKGEMTNKEFMRRLREGYNKHVSRRLVLR